MYSKHIHQAPLFVAGDATNLRELLHPKNDPVHVEYSIAHAYIRPHEASTPHRLTSSEVYYILAGTGLIHVEGVSQTLSKDQVIFVPPNALQHVENTGNVDLIFLCIVQPAWAPEEEKME